MSDQQTNNVTSNRPQPTGDPVQPVQAIEDAGRYEQSKTEDRKRRRCRKLAKAPIWIEAFAAIVLIGITAFYTHYAKIQAEQAIIAATAAKSAADTARDALVVVNRPWLGIDGPMTVLEPLTTDKDGFHAHVGFLIKNFGPSPALHFGIYEVIQNSTEDARPDGTVDFANFKREGDISCKMADMATNPIVPGESGSGPYIFPNNSQPYGPYMTRGTAPDQSTSLDIIGCIVYADQFKIIHHTRFCFMGQKAIKDTKAMDRLTTCPINANAD
jgi:hypothetical protein